EVVGLVPQAPQTGLWPALTALENVLVPMLDGGGGEQERLDRATALLDALGLGEHAHRRPDELTPVERLRTSIAVALANQPRLLLADELTADLDDAEAGALARDILRLLRRRGTAAVMASGDPRLTGQADRVVRLPDPPGA